ncbi:DNA translocase FtsK [Brevibacillus massiliensis]|jgi:S-DNA-T family DNA segregation ATPase FtsK/SpoIIIE|uniref:DNA translocase FtsK n=1 Tax=Brevibacillus massiliensis TaxID=1118054 RepID=UPI00030C83C4|nr:DNA translocase FtsK [Brevibacillus massiliensis]
MWTWLQKIVEGLVGEKKEEPKGSPVSYPSGRPLEARTTNIYPKERNLSKEPNVLKGPGPVQPEEPTKPRRKGEFRFPVIPDPPKDKVERPEHTTPVKSSVPKQPKPVKREPTFIVNRSAAEPRRTFTPTEVFSPVYGRMTPKEGEEKLWPRATPKSPDPVPETEEALPIDLFKRMSASREGEAEPLAQGALSRSETAAAVEKSATAEPIGLPMAAGKEPERADWTEQVPEPEPEPQRAGWTEQVPEPEPEPEKADWTEQVLESESEPEKADWTEHAPELEPEPERPAAVQQPENGNLQPVTERPRAAEPLIARTQPPEPAVQAAAPIPRGYTYPPFDLLNPSPELAQEGEEHTLEQKRLLEETLSNFNVSAQVVGIVKGPTVTRFELQPAPGVKVNKITSLSDDIKLSLAAKDIRIEAPIPGRNAVGIEVPNLKAEPVFISRIIGSEAFQNHPSPLAVALGMDIGGMPIVADIKKMPHGLIAGSTGSGKSVCINSIIISLLYKASPQQVRLLLIDPKMVELAPYNHLPHLVTPVVTDAKQATAALKWAVEEMERRYTLFAEAGARDIERYNQISGERLPYIVIIIDELADLMMVSPQDVEDCIIRIAQKARACGIHLLLATQRPSVDVITGNIKANVPTRLAFAVFSQVDSRTILDQTGAERLLGRGDMLFLESGTNTLRLQGNFVSDDEIERVTLFIKRQCQPEYLFSKEELEQSVQTYDAGDDELYFEALVHVAEQGQASASALQRRFRIGYNRAARLIEMMEADGYVAGQSGGKPRAVLISAEDARALAEGTSLF